MMGRVIVSVSLILLPSPLFAQSVTTDPAPSCLHGNSETAVERQRREEALAAMRLIDGILWTPPILRQESPRWEEVSESAAVTRLRAQGHKGALRIRWGTGEPLPGWGLAWVTGRTGSRFALIDLHDPCAFTYSSANPDVLPRGRGRIGAPPQVP